MGDTPTSTPPRMRSETPTEESPEDTLMLTPTVSSRELNTSPTELVSVLLTLVSQLPQPSTQSPWLPQPLTQSLWLPQSMTELPQNQSRTPQRLPRPRPLTSPLLPPQRPVREEDVRLTQLSSLEPPES